MIKRNKFSINDALRAYPIAFATYFLAVGVASITWLLPVSLLEGIWVNLKLSQWLLVLLSTLSLFLSSFLFCRVCKINFKKAVGLDKKPDVKATLIGMFTVLGMICLLLPLANFFVDGLSAILEEMGKEAYVVVETPESGNIVWDIIASVIFVCFVPGFCEEVLMRGVIANGLGSKLRKIPASLLSGLIFMLFHMNPAQTVYQFALGFVLSYILLTTGSLWIPIILHTFNNLVSVILDYSMSEELQTLVFLDNWYITMAVGAVVVAIGIFLFIKFVPDTFKKPTEFGQEELSQNYEESSQQPVGGQSQESPEQDASEQAVFEQEVYTQADFTEQDNSAISVQENETITQSKSAANNVVDAIPLVLSIVAATICCIVWVVTLFGG